MRRLVVFAGAVAAAACGPSFPTAHDIDLMRATRESLVTVRAREHDAAWRARIFPAAGLHGPFGRPTLPDTADPNDALAYYVLGRQTMDSAAGLADRAFYWATRLDPAMADAYIARWTLRRSEVWREWPDSTIHVVNWRDIAVRAANDSLVLAAVRHNPFVDQQLNLPKFVLTGDRDPSFAGMRAFERRDFKESVVLLRAALRQHPERMLLHLTRAMAWVRLAENDSAIADLTALTNRIEKLQKDSTIVPYISKEMMFYGIGMLQADAHRPVAARAAYQRALVENLGFYMAHARLAATWLAEHDTASALGELESAVLIRADDPFVDHYYGFLLLLAGRYAEAATQLRAAIAADSDYAAPHVALAHLLDVQGDTAGARAEYERFLAHATRTAPERTRVLSRLRR